MATILSKIHRLVAARSFLVYLISEEEERVERLVATATAKAFGNGAAPYVWSCTTGMRKSGRPVSDVKDPVEALEAFLSVKDAGVLIFKDLHLFLNGQAPLIRQLREAARAVRAERKTIVFICPYLGLPHELYPLFKIEDVPLPRYDEISRMLDMVVDAHPRKEQLRASMTDNLRGKLVRASLGFTATEAMDAMRMALIGEQEISERTVDTVLGEKEALVRKSGVLEFVPTATGQWEIGGLFNLKKWLKERDEAFSPKAAERGLPTPKGILAMGISGCGKSLCIKAIAAHWKLPLLRLDMGRLYDGLAGPPEDAMRNAIKTAEAVAPCVLWIDEIEAGIANQQQKAEGKSESRVLAIFLTWMQEKTAPVFVGATANEVEVLPPEILRKGRFDELFYVGLPDEDEREQIIGIHMLRRGLDPKQFDMKYLTSSTKGYNGAEIEQGIISAVFEAESNGVPTTEHILANTFRRIVPLSRTMRERIEKIEAWARDRAMKASLQKF